MQKLGRVSVPLHAGSTKNDASVSERNTKEEEKDETKNEKDFLYEVLLILRLMYLPPYTTLMSLITMI